MRRPSLQMRSVSKWSSRSTAADRGEDGRELVGPFRRNQARDRLPHHLLGAVAEDALGTLVPARDHPFERLRDDGVVGGLDDGGQAHASLELLLAVADVGERADPLTDAPLFVEDGRRTREHPGVAPVEPAQAALHLDGGLGQHDARPELDHALSIFRVQRVEPAPPSGFLERLPRECLPAP